MEKNHQGPLMLWPGVAEELLATKAYYVRAGMFKASTPQSSPCQQGLLDRLGFGRQ
jgi:metal-dependent amidase/aminoacylase/carboxypeptidase family protein